MNEFSLQETIKIGLVTAATLLPFIMAIVTYLGKLGVSGVAQLLSSMGIGLFFGGLAMYLQINPTNLGGWFAVLIVGLSAGLGASGVYEVGKEIAVKATSKG